MVNRSLILSRLDEIRRSTGRLAKLAELSVTEFLQDPDHFAVAEHHLRRALEAALDAGRHVIAKEGWGKPADYRDVFDILGARGVLPAEFARRIRGMAGYRNRLVHMYAEVTAEEVHQLLRERLGELLQFARYVLDWTDRARPTDPDDSHR